MSNILIYKQKDLIGDFKHQVKSDNSTLIIASNFSKNDISRFTDNEKYRTLISALYNFVPGSGSIILLDSSVYQKICKYYNFDSNKTVNICMVDRSGREKKTDIRETVFSIIEKILK
jgi:hypothetical protein